MDITIDIRTITLETERLLLRPGRMDDLDDFFAYASVDGVGQMAGWQPHASRDVSRSILDKWTAEGEVFAIEHKGDGRVIGSLGVHTTRWEKTPGLDNPYAAKRTKELGYVLSRDYWGQGLMPEAVRRVQKYLFDEKHADILFVSHYDFTTQSRRVIEKCGFVYLTEVEHYAKQLDRTLHLLHYCLPRETYYANNSGNF